MYHNPVLLEKSIEGLNIIPNGNYVDVTFGGGGHSKAILQKLKNGKLIAFDQDSDSLKNTITDDRFYLVNNNFQFLKNFLRLHNVSKVNGILADLGVSSHQFDVPERGFSTRFDAPLDMRMNLNQQVKAADIVNSYSEEELHSLFKNYGEIKNSKCFSRAIIEARKSHPINTTGELIESIQNCLPKIKKNKFLAQVFQALRIEVNDEMQVLKEMLLQAADSLILGGRLVVISYHSLEDRLVKNFIRSGNFNGIVKKDFYGNPIVSFKSITRKPIVPDEIEIENNNRARSAKLRIAEKI
ncbi:MAG: 16S rRNA (cytosine(1402)-N(4))-methyltransferase [Bacteroidetes bacterium]|nr:16S rRNA (cytosine(1402)-N(4))-methyltransferase [Bacteroidota bacterium]|tara:strand:+ start:760 stop:1653 length:894 start_codon:yes stop_codon:yes gene_type:complete